jgi:hypothetical protein
MKKILIILYVSIYFLTNIYAQQNVNNKVQSSTFEYQQISSNSQQFTFKTWILDYFIVTNISSINIINDTLEVRMLYDITESTFNFGNPIYYENTINFNQVIPSSINFIKMSTDVKLLSDNPPYNPLTIENVYFRIIDLNNLGLTKEKVNKIDIYPNPTSNMVQITFRKLEQNSKITLENSLGQKTSEQTFKNLDTIYYPIDGESGLYFLTIENENGEKQTHKIIKK